MLPDKESLPKESRGLSSTEAESRLKKYGQNVLPEKPPPSDIRIFIAQLKNPLVYILVAAGLVTLALRDYSDSLIIFFAVAVNTLLGFIQERRANRSLQALKELIHPEAEVVRDERIEKIEVEKIVPGDVVVLNQGSKIPADGKLVFANRVFVDESILTGESVSVGKREKDKVFMGTIVVAGKAYMEVELTGADTAVGKIAEKVQEPHEDTPLRVQLKRLSKELSILVLILTTTVFLVGFLGGRPIVEIFTISVALAVSSIPEGLLVGLTVVLAIGMQKILRRKGLVRHLVSAETLGGVTIICADKTGTLTEGKMQVVEAIGSIKEMSLQAVVANDLDDPIVIAAFEWAKKNIPSKDGLLKKHKRLDSIPFSSKDRYFVSLNEWNGENNMIFVNGAPEFLLNWSIMPAKKRRQMKIQIDSLTQEGKRIVGMARKKVSTSKKNLNEKDAKTALHFLGLLVFSDPIRKGVRKALDETKKAGVKTLVITGDYSKTAIAVMNELGFEVKKDEFLEGEDLARLDDRELQKRLKGEREIKLFARTTPEQKLKIIEALKKNGEVVAMMGDGVNDAPALKKADIGIVVGEASDVAKETADLVLLDSSFSTIVSSIEEGRGIFDNIRKIILYLMSDAFEEIIAVIGTLILGLPLPVTAGQILWINLVSDGFPDLALTVDPKTKGIMSKPPRSPGEHLMTDWMKMLIGIVSLVGGLIALTLFIYFYNSTGNLILARSVAFSALGVNSLVFVFSVRTLTKPFWQENPLENKWLNIAVLAGLVLQFLPFTSGLKGFFGLEFPGFYPLALVFAASFLMFIIIEALKALVRRHIEWFQH